MTEPEIVQYLDPTVDFVRDRARFITEIIWPDGTVTVADTVTVSMRQMADPASPAIERCTTQAVAKARAIIELS